MYRFLCEQMFSFLWLQCPEVWWVGSMQSICSVWEKKKKFHNYFPEWLNQLEGRIQNMLSPSLVYNIIVSSISSTYMERRIRMSLICASPVKQDWKHQGRRKGYCVQPYFCLLCAFFLPDSLRPLLSPFLFFWENFLWV